MKIEYILVLKKKSKDTVRIKPRIQNVLKSCFESVGSDNFVVKYKSTSYSLNFNCSVHTASAAGNNNAIYYLVISYGNAKNEATATVLDYAHTCLMAKINSGESKFHVTISYDERAQYFCQRAYPYFCEFESKLRCLILKLLTRTYGVLWAEKTLTKEQREQLQAKLKGANLEKVASEALYEMDISTLEEYLFGKTRDVDLETIIDNELTPTKLAELDKDAIVKIINKGRPQSNWQRYFEKEISISNLEEKLSIIRTERNKVAHIKHYCQKDYGDDRAILVGFIEKLDEAIAKIEAKEMTSIDIVEVLGKLCLAFVSVCSQMQEPIEQIVKSTQVIIDSLASIKPIKTPMLFESATIMTNSIKNALASTPKFYIPSLDSVSIDSPKIEIPISSTSLSKTSIPLSPSKTPKISFVTEALTSQTKPSININELRESVLKETHD